VLRLRLDHGAQWGLLQMPELRLNERLLVAPFFVTVLTGAARQAALRF